MTLLPVASGNDHQVVTTYQCHAHSSDQVVAIGGQWVDTTRVVGWISVLFHGQIFNYSYCNY